ncbi:GIY-YIG nuclease family protein [Halovulum dunhuangense]|uniref:GIY-YIG nuclease family protein n=1 Tax=Halovulum dunhuangense TaxID=1505036 RepID=A0A849KWB2_9RHOB|nr:GIY-YIG nuclease family protein [Halovulum dunhuangense]NNU79495.1 GIY-YIG nuclease family protein [Halovulum dunhuangense]
MPHFVYILASRPGGALYTGATSDLRRRVEQHRARVVPGHTARYGIGTLVWFEIHETREAALARERSIKRWRRLWKDQLILGLNPDWRDISGLIP